MAAALLPPSLLGVSAARELTLLPSDDPIRRRDAAAVCLSGQVRSLLDVHQTLRERLVDPFLEHGGAQLFMHVSLTSTFTRYHDDDPPLNETMTFRQLQPALEALTPTAVQLYTEGDVAATGLHPSTCNNDPTDRSAGWTYNSVQFWGISRCFAMIDAAERAMGKIFRLAVRARPDVLPDPQIVDLFGEALREAADSQWVSLGSSSGADSLVVAKGPNATAAVASIWGEFTGGCLSAAFPDVTASRALCSPFDFEINGTECLVLRHLHAVSNLQVCVFG